MPANSARAEMSSVLDYSNITLPSRLESTTLDTNQLTSSILENNHYATNSLDFETITINGDYLESPVIRVHPSSILQDLNNHFVFEFPNGNFPTTTNLMDWELLPPRFNFRRKLELFFYDAPNGSEVGFVSLIRNMQRTLDVNHLGDENFHGLVLADIQNLYNMRVALLNHINATTFLFKS